MLERYFLTTREGMAAPHQALPGALKVLEARLPAVLIASLREQWVRIQHLDTEIAMIEQRLVVILKETPQCQAAASRSRLRASHGHGSRREHR